MVTESIDKLFLELSQFTQATTAKELELKRLLNNWIAWYEMGGGSLGSLERETRKALDKRGK